MLEALAYLASWNRRANQLTAAVSASTCSIGLGFGPANSFARWMSSRRRVAFVSFVVFFPARPVDQLADRPIVHRAFAPIDADDCVLI